MAREHDPLYPITADPFCRNDSWYKPVAAQRVKSGSDLACKNVCVFGGVEIISTFHTRHHVRSQVSVDQKLSPQKRIGMCGSKPGRALRKNQLGSVCCWKQLARKSAGALIFMNLATNLGQADSLCLYFKLWLSQRRKR